MARPSVQVKPACSDDRFDRLAARPILIRIVFSILAADGFVDDRG